MPLDVNAIKALLGAEDRSLPPQVGPIKWYDKEMRCASRGCSSSTYIKFCGIPKCMMHTLREANELMVEHDIGTS
jgi:hypothetical protein